MRVKEDITRHTFHLRVGDVEKLQMLHPTIGAAKIIRTLVANYVDKVEAGDEKPRLKIDGVTV